MLNKIAMGKISEKPSAIGKRNHGSLDETNISCSVSKGEGILLPSYKRYKPWNMGRSVVAYWALKATQRH